MRTTTEVPREGPNPPAAPAAPRAEPPRTLEVRDVSRTFAPLRRGRTGIPALDRVSLTAAPGEVVAVVGPSGCGKSTLLEIVCGLQAPDAGTVDGPPAVLMPQRDGLLPWLTALDNAALPLRIAGTRKADARERAHALLADLGLAGFERAAPDELSGGMRQRVAFARTLLSGKPVLCLDEPFGALDAITRPELHAWLAATLDRAPRTVLLVTHDVEEAAVLADRIVVLTPRPGRVAATLDAGGLPPRTRRRAIDPAVQDLRARALEVLRA